MTPTKVLIGQILIVFAIVIAGVWAATQWAAYQLGYQVQLGEPLAVLFGTPVYRPWRLFEWWYAYAAYAPHIPTRSSRQGLGVSMKLRQLLSAASPPMFRFARKGFVVQDGKATGTLDDKVDPSDTTLLPEMAEQRQLPAHDGVRPRRFDVAHNRSAASSASSPSSPVRYPEPGRRGQGTALGSDDNRKRIERSFQTTYTRS